MTTEKRKMMTIYLDYNDTEGELPLYEAIVRHLVHLEVAGATVLTGIMGFGRGGKVHRKRLFGVTDDKPVIIRVVDREEKIMTALAQIRPMVTEGLIQLQDVEVVL